ncbi:MAG: HpcH/HpaI aldolase family protein [Limnochordia bacterium]|jgi:2-keto-3-deoxy-L-rhamnonate aldolase RhmA|nr:2,4-dihydroxyhept-2-ene-1,7-dioic acid aldolase [Bacillota bacterium]
MVMSSLKTALAENRLTIGSWIQIGHPAVAETLATLGFEWLVVDLEHADIGIKGFADVIRGLHGRGPLPLARVRENDTLAIRQVLDAGAKGVIVPLVNSAEEAARAVEAAKYPPEGVRGFAFCRANEWGINFDAYCSAANNAIAVIVMIESKQAVDNIEDILAVEGVDGVFIGPYDMSGSYGVTGQTDHPLVLEACHKVVRACQTQGKAAGLHVVNATEDAISQALKDGFTFLAIGMDTVFLKQAAERARNCALKGNL